MSKLPAIISGIILLSIIPYAFAEYEDTLVLLKTNSGDLVIEFFPNDAPNHVESFLRLSSNVDTDPKIMNKLAEVQVPQNIYKETVFHRIIPEFMIQGGDFNTRVNFDDDRSWGQGNIGYFIDCEFNDIKHKRGIVSMARAPDPNSAGTQFFIVHKDSTFLDGQYTVFGRLATQESFQTLDKIASLETGQRDIPVDREAAKIIETQVLERSAFDNLLELDPPKRGNISTGLCYDKGNSGEYADEELGFSFNIPIGWSVSNPEIQNIHTPQVAVLGPVGSDGIPAAFAVNVKNSTASLDEVILAFENTILTAMDVNVIEIISKENIKLGNFDGQRITFYQIFDKAGSGENVSDGMVQLRIEIYFIKTSDNRIFTLQFTNVSENYNDTTGQFKDILDSFKIKNAILQASATNESELQPIEEQSESSEGGGCLIATAAYGSEMAPQVQFLREIRDNTVLQTQSGTSFMTAFNQFYYSFSPTVADYERENPVFKQAVKVGLTPLLTSLTILNYVDIDTEQEMLGYGIGIIMLNIGMYFVAPAVVIIALKKRRR